MYKDVFETSKQNLSVCISKLKGQKKIRYRLHEEHAIVLADKNLHQHCLEYCSFNGLGTIPHLVIKLHCNRLSKDAILKNDASV
jgi:hypothetical protein